MCNVLIIYGFVKYYRQWRSRARIGVELEGIEPSPGRVQSPPGAPSQPQIGQFSHELAFFLSPPPFYKNIIISPVGLVI